MQSASDLRDVGALALVPGLTSLRLMDCVKLRDVRALSSLVRLTSLSLAGALLLRLLPAPHPPMPACRKVAWPLCGRARRGCSSGWRQAPGTPAGTPNPRVRDRTSCLISAHQHVHT